MIRTTLRLTIAAAVTVGAFVYGINETAYPAFGLLVGMAAVPMGIATLAIGD